MELWLHLLLTAVFYGGDVLTAPLDRFATGTEPQKRPTIRLCECVILSGLFGTERRGEERRGEENFVFGRFQLSPMSFA
jgi:hypothetical protein